MAKNLLQNATADGPGKSWRRSGDVVKSGLIRGINAGTGTSSLDITDENGGIIIQIGVPASKGIDPVEVALPAAYSSALSGTAGTVDVTAWVDGDDS